MKRLIFCIVTFLFFDYQSYGNPVKRNPSPAYPPAPAYTNPPYTTGAVPAPPAYNNPTSTKPSGTPNLPPNYPPGNPTHLPRSTYQSGAQVNPVYTAGRPSPNNPPTGSYTNNPAYPAHISVPTYDKPSSGNPTYNPNPSYNPSGVPTYTVSTPPGNPSYTSASIPLYSSPNPYPESYTLSYPLNQYYSPSSFAQSLASIQLQNPSYGTTTQPVMQPTYGVTNPSYGYKPDNYGASVYSSQPLYVNPVAQQYNEVSGQPVSMVDADIAKYIEDSMDEDYYGLQQRGYSSDLPDTYYDSYVNQGSPINSHIYPSGPSYAYDYTINPRSSSKSTSESDPSSDGRKRLHISLSFPFLHSESLSIPFTSESLTKPIQSASQSLASSQLVPLAPIDSLTSSSSLVSGSLKNIALSPESLASDQLLSETIDLPGKLTSESLASGPSATETLNLPSKLTSEALASGTSLTETLNLPNKLASEALASGTSLTDTIHLPTNLASDSLASTTSLVGDPLKNIPLASQSLSTVSIPLVSQSVPLVENLASVPAQLTGLMKEEEAVVNVADDTLAGEESAIETILKPDSLGGATDGLFTPLETVAIPNTDAVPTVVKGVSKFANPVLTVHSSSESQSPKEHEGHRGFTVLVSSRAKDDDQGQYETYEPTCNCKDKEYQPQYPFAATQGYAPLQPYGRYSYSPLPYIPGFPYMAVGYPPMRPPLRTYGYGRPQY